MFLTLNAALAIPAAAALICIKEAQNPIKYSIDSSPLGYTWSLGLFLVPVLIFGCLTLAILKVPHRRKAFFLTLSILCPIGFGLDIFFGTAFFSFPNTFAVLGGSHPWLMLPSYGWTEGHWRPHYIPIEEMFFYSLGFTAILVTYISAENVWFKPSKVDLTQETPLPFKTIKYAIPFWVGIGVILCLIAIGITHLQSISDGGVKSRPGYFIFLVVTAIIPSMFLFNKSFHFINWRALTMAWLFILVVSQFWEGSLGVPYQWWVYNKENMIGIMIKPQCQLPIEAVLVWSLSSWTTVVIYEYIAFRCHRKDYEKYVASRSAVASVQPPQTSFGPQFSFIPEPSFHFGGPHINDQITWMKEEYKKQLGQ